MCSLEVRSREMQNDLSQCVFNKALFILNLINNAGNQSGNREFIFHLFYNFNRAEKFHLFLSVGDCILLI